MGHHHCRAGQVNLCCLVLDRQHTINETDARGTMSKCRHVQEGQDGKDPTGRHEMQE